MIEITGKRMRRICCVYMEQTEGWGIGRGAKKKGYRGGRNKGFADEREKG